MAHRFYLYAKQSGGCDYTIACGEKLVPLNAETFGEAAVETAQWVREHEYDERLFESVDLLHAVVTPIDLDEIRRGIAAERAAEQRSEQEQAERAELARLLAKYEGRK